MRTDDLQGRPDDFRRCGHGAGDHAVGNIEDNQTGRKEDIIFRQNFPGFFQRHALLGPPFSIIFAKFVHHRVRFRVDDFNAIHIDLIFRSYFDDILRTANENRPGKAFGLDPFSSLQDAATFRLRQDNFLLFFGNAAFQVINKT